MARSRWNLFWFSLVSAGCGEAVTAPDASAPACVPDRAVWDASVRAIVQRQCGACHGAQPQFGAPFSLLDYDANLRGASGRRPVDRMAARLVEGTMPPAGTPSPTEDDARALVGWASCNTQGATLRPVLRASAPVFRAPETAPAGLSHVDLRAPSYQFGLNVTERYQCFAFDAPVTEAQFIRRFEAVLDDRRVVHHIVLLRDTQRTAPGTAFECTGMPEGSDYLYAWAPGQDALQFPEGGLRMRPGDRYVLQLHYNNGARLPSVTDTSGVRLYYSAPSGTEYGMIAVGPVGFSLPARRETTVASGCSLPVGSRVLAGMPHMHELGAAFQQDVVRASGAREPMISLQNWRFESQLFYELPATLGPGDRIETRCIFNNTNDRTVTNGSRTSDEMCFNFAYVTPPPTERYCDQPLGEVNDVVYHPGACAPPGTGSDLPLTTGDVTLDPAPELAGTSLPEGRWVLSGARFHVDRAQTAIGTLDTVMSGLRLRGQLWTTATGLTADLVNVLDLVITGGARFSRPINASFRASFTSSASPLALTAECPTGTMGVPTSVTYAVEGDRLTVGLPSVSSAGVRITPRYVFTRAR